MYPLERVLDVEQSLVARGCVGFAAQFSQKEVTHQAEAVVCLDHHDVIGTGQVAPILVVGTSGALEESATVAVHHDGTLAVVGCRRPDIQEEAVFGRRRLVDAVIALSWLRRRSAQSQCVPYASPRLQWWRRLESICSSHDTTVRNTQEGKQVRLAKTTHTAVGGADFRML